MGGQATVTGRPAQGMLLAQYYLHTVIGTHDFYFYLQLICVSELNQGQDKALNFESANSNTAYSPFICV